MKYSVVPGFAVTFSVTFAFCFGAMKAMSPGPSIFGGVLVPFRR